MEGRKEEGEGRGRMARVVRGTILVMMIIEAVRNPVTTFLPVGSTKGQDLHKKI
jgi:hypothetical protein